MVIVGEVLYRRVNAREEQALVTVVAPSDNERRAAVNSVDLEHFAISFGLTGTMTLDHDAISNACLHLSLHCSSPLYRFRGGRSRGEGPEVHGLNVLRRTSTVAAATRRRTQTSPDTSRAS